jgi:transcriptional activator of cad operon
MTFPPSAKLRIGAWCVDPAAGQISRGGEVVRLEARTLRLLLDLAEHAGQVVSIDALLDRVWAGVIVTPDSVYQAVASLRRLLGDDPRRPSYIATVPRLGYRLIATVGPWPGELGSPGPAPRRPGPTIMVGGVVAAGLFLASALVLFQQSRAPPHAAVAAAAQPITVGVLPFLDLTPQMDELPLADDVTEGLIDKLSKNPRLRTPGFRASLLLRGKHASLADAAKTLGVRYVVDGSVRLSGDYVRIAARLMRADNGFVIWSQSYYQPVRETFLIQDSIASGVSRTLAATKPAV